MDSWFGRTRNAPPEDPRAKELKTKADKCVSELPPEDRRILVRFTEEFDRRDGKWRIAPNTIDDIGTPRNLPSLDVDVPDVGSARMVTDHLNNKLKKMGKFRAPWVSHLGDSFRRHRRKPFDWPQE